VCVCSACRLVSCAHFHDTCCSKFMRATARHQRRNSPRATPSRLPPLGFSLTATFPSLFICTRHFVEQATCYYRDDAARMIESLNGLLLGEGLRALYTYMPRRDLAASAIIDVSWVFSDSHLKESNLGIDKTMIHNILDDIREVHVQANRLRSLAPSDMLSMLSNQSNVVK
jgi:hypothetical protein